VLMCHCQDQHLHSFFTHCQRLENFSAAGTDTDTPASRNKVSYLLAHMAVMILSIAKLS